MKSFLDDVVLTAAAPEKDEDHVIISTIHSAKGLEYENVYIPRAIQGVFPRYNATQEELAEELRCMYVALTRAKDRLHIYCPREVMMGNKTKPAAPSMFLHQSVVLNTLKMKF